MIGGLILVWIAVGIRNLGKINTVAMARAVRADGDSRRRDLSGGNPGYSGGRRRGGAQLRGRGGAVRGDAAVLAALNQRLYTEAERPLAATAASAGVYGVVSCFMYAIGMGAAICTGGSDIAQIMVKAGLGTAGLLIIILVPP